MAETKKTEFAMKAFGLAELFRMQFGDQKIAGSPSYLIELSAPDGPSTGGGKQAVQHVKLVPEEGGVTIVAGTANQMQLTSELRTYEYLAAVHGQRFKGAPLPLDRDLYTDLIKKVQAFLTGTGLNVVMLDTPRPATGSLPIVPQQQRSAVLPALIIMLVFTLASAIFYFVQTRPR